MKRKALSTILALGVLALLLSGLAFVLRGQSPGSAPAPRVSQIQGWAPPQIWMLGPGQDPQSVVPCDVPGSVVPPGVIGMAARWDEADVEASTAAEQGAVAAPLSGDAVYRCLVNSQGQYGWVRLGGAQ